MIKKFALVTAISLSAVLIVILAVAAILVNTKQEVSAAKASDFKPGRIIDDFVFYKSSSMSVAQIQNFLNSKVPNCDTNGTGMASDWGRPDITRATLASYIRNGTNGYTKNTAFHAPPYTCLRDYKKNTPQMEAASGLCSGVSAKTNQTAAQMIQAVANACGINPQVLIVLLEKEQSLVTDVWPLQRQFNSATGFDCPDTAPCDPAYAGLFYQIYYAARQFKVYQKYPNDYNYIAGRTNRIYWHPDLTRCGSSQVYIENQATAALYIYTPYRPNQAALNNLYGTGDSCSSYGNRNFWRLFTDWFGSTMVSYSSFDSPRIMQIKQPTEKVSLHTNEEFGPVLSAGSQTYFVDKIFIYDKWYARTEYDHNNNNFVGIPVSDLEEVPIQNITPKWISIDNDTEKVDPLRRTTIGPVYSKSAARVLSKITVSGTEYLRTAFDHTAGRTHFIRADKTTDFKFYSFDSPRVLVSSRAANKIDVLSGNTVSTIPAGTLLSFSNRIIIDGVQYAQADSDNDTNYAYKFSDFVESTNAGPYFVSLDSPRWMQIGTNTSKLHVSSKQTFGPELLSGAQAYFVDKILIDGTWYARTQYDKDRNNSDVIPAADLTDISITSITPKWMSIKSKTQKIDPTRGTQFEAIEDLTAARFVDKITVGGKDYYRTAYERDQGRYRFIPADALVDFEFFDFAKPRQMITKTSTNRVNVQTGAVASSIPANTTIFFNKRITIDGVLYAQAESDNGTVFAVRASALREK